MKIKLTIVILLIFGTAACLFWSNRSPGSEARPAKREPLGPEFHQKADAAEQHVKSRSRQRSDAPGSELAARFGETKTDTARKIIGDMVGMIKESLFALDRLEKGSDDVMTTAFAGDLPSRLALTGDQKAGMEKLAADCRKKRLEHLKEVAENLKTEPAPWMEMLLVGDAVASGQADRAEYEALVDRLQQEGFPRGGMDSLHDLDSSPVLDPEFRGQLEPLLDPAQRDALQEIVADEEAKAREARNKAREFSPIFSLDETRELTSAMRQMMSGFLDMAEEIRSAMKPGAAEQEH